MNELTDLQICQRIAEIEGRGISGVGSLNVFVKCEPSLIGNEQYDPLTDDALCFKLMVKHSIRVEPENCSAWTDNDDGYPQYEVIHCKGTINKAICLAIIKSKE
jgi:hypothetical protein